MLNVEQARAMRAGVTLRGDRNQCGECGLLFASTPAYDRHRVADHVGMRRCLVPEDLSRVGMMKDEQGFWIQRAVAIAKADRLILPTVKMPSCIDDRT